MKWSGDSWRAHQNADKLWYFWDESDAFEIGPYRSKADCVNALELYGQYLDKQISFNQFTDQSKLIKGIPHG